MRVLSAVLLVLAVAACSHPAAAQPEASGTAWEAYLPPYGSPASPLGFWRGGVTRDGASQIVELDVAVNDTASVDPATGRRPLVVRCRMPDWFGWPPLACDRAATFAGDTLTTDFLYDLRLSLRLDPAFGELVGAAEGTAMPVRAHFRRAVRPPEPAVRAVDVTIPSGDAQIAGTLVTPARPGPHPVVVFIHGRGPGQRGWGSYRNQAATLARYGVAGFVYDKRGVAASTGDFEGASLHDHADDVAAIMQALAARDEIDGDQIGLHGSSAGGWVATIAQARSPVRPAFIVTRVGPFESVYDQQWHVAQAYMSERGYTPEQIASAIEYVKLESGTDASDAAVEAMQAGARRAESEGWADILVDPPMTREALEASWARVNRYDPAGDLRSLTMPLLAFFGEEDYVVHPRYNVPALEAAMAASGNGDVTIVVHPRMNHGLENPTALRTFEDGDFTRAYVVWNRIAAGYGETFIRWILDRVTLASERDS